MNGSWCLKGVIKSGWNRTPGEGKNSVGCDPGIGILLVPVGALLMLFGVGNVVAGFVSIQRRTGKR